MKELKIKLNGKNYSIKNDDLSLGRPSILDCANEHYVYRSVDVYDSYLDLITGYDAYQEDPMNVCEIQKKIPGEFIPLAHHAMDTIREFLEDSLFDTETDLKYVIVESYTIINDKNLIEGLDDYWEYNETHSELYDRPEFITDVETVNSYFEKYLIGLGFKLV